jgi:hypothetical protein
MKKQLLTLLGLGLLLTTVSAYAQISNSKPMSLSTLS